MVAIPSTVERVPLHTREEYNLRIRQQLEENVACYAGEGRAAISKRLEELDHEWDMERTLEANAASVALVGLALGAFVDRRLFVLPAFVVGFLLQHAIQGWCPPVNFLRRFGVRTQSEIDEERYALKAIRGDFQTAGGTGNEALSAQLALQAVRR